MHTGASHNVTDRLVSVEKRDGAPVMSKKEASALFTTKSVPEKQYDMPTEDKKSPHHGVDSESVDVQLRSPKRNEKVSVPPSLWKSEGTLAVAGGFKTLNVRICRGHPGNVHHGRVVEGTVDGSVDLLHTTCYGPPLHRQVHTSKVVAPAVGSRVRANRSAQLAATEPHPEVILGDMR